MIFYDHREASSGIPGLLALEGFTLTSAQLPVGDYVVSDRVGIERKTEADLVASIKDQRLFDQVKRLREAYPAAILLVERANSNFPAEARAGALAWALRQGVSVLPVTSPETSAEWIARLARQEASGPSGPRGSARKPAEPDRLAKEVAANLPGISLVLAGRLLEHFGTLQALFSAGAPDLQRVEGIGPKRARALSELLHRRYGQDEDDSPF